jgi:hypothetical protein
VKHANCSNSSTNASSRDLSERGTNDLGIIGGHTVKHMKSACARAPVCRCPVTEKKKKEIQ